MKAAEALGGWIEAAEDTGQPVPAPTDVRSAVEGSPGASLVWVPAPTPKSKAVAVSISLNQRVLHRIDAAAEAIGLTRSSFIAHAALTAAGASAAKVKAKSRRRAKAA